MCTYVDIYLGDSEERTTISNNSDYEYENIVNELVLTGKIEDDLLNTTYYEYANITNEIVTEKIFPNSSQHYEYPNITTELPIEKLNSTEYYYEYLNITTELPVEKVVGVLNSTEYYEYPNITTELTVEKVDDVLNSTRKLNFFENERYIFLISTYFFQLLSPQVYIPRQQVEIL